MQNTLYVIIALFVGLAAVFYFMNKKLFVVGNEPQNSKVMLQLMGELRRDIQNQQGQQRQELDQRLHQLSLLMKNQQSSTTETLQKQFKQSAAIVQEVTQNLTQLKETNKKIVGFAEQMKSLENILKSPKQRGILGEYALETLLTNHMHGNFQMQYPMKNGEIVDAMIFFNEMKIPVDSKFSLEKYNQMTQATDPSQREALEKGFRNDVKKRIDETSKYIRPEEGTTEFAFMFVPAEGIYYNLTIESVGSLKVNTRNLIEYAFAKRVIIVSPSSFFAYLQTVIQGMKAFEMSKNVAQMIKGVETLGRHVNAYDSYFKKLGKHLGTTVNTYNHASREFKKIDKDIYKLSEGQAGGKIEVEALDRPSLEDGA
jgi:DNA recombination protein RmuC